jgi:hypothetical protein
VGWWGEGKKKKKPTTTSNTLEFHSFAANSGNYAASHTSQKGHERPHE